MTIKLNEVDKVKILTLKDQEIKNSILAQHGDSAIVTVGATTWKPWTVLAWFTPSGRR